MYEKSKSLNMKVTERVRFRARLMGDHGEFDEERELDVWLPTRDVERIYRNARRSTLRSILLFLANRL